MVYLPSGRFCESSAASPLPLRSQAIGMFRERCFVRNLHRLPVYVEGPVRRLVARLQPAHRGGRPSVTAPASRDIEASEGSACNQVVFTYCPSKEALMNA